MTVEQIADVIEALCGINQILTDATLEERAATFATLGIWMGTIVVTLQQRHGLERPQQAAIVTAGHAFVQNLRRGHHELGVDVASRHRAAAAFNELAAVI